MPDDGDTEGEGEILGVAVGVGKPEGLDIGVLSGRIHKEILFSRVASYCPAILEGINERVIG